jgi:hypothetical protein
LPATLSNALKFIDKDFMTNLNLHDLAIVVDDGPPQQLEDYSTKTSSPHFDTVEVMFRDQESRLVDIIKTFENGAIFGCIAWLTSTPILKALGKCKNVQIIVQKEDFLRPDIDTKNIDKWKSDLWKLYSNLKCDIERHQFREPMGHLSVCGDPTVDGIRCVGNHNFEKKPAFPRAHHKFLVFCSINETEDTTSYTPVALWTGSFNLTKNATNSFENVLYFTDASGNNEIINAFLNEHHQIFALSEPLNWSDVWTAPEFRIGS